MVAWRPPSTLAFASPGERPRATDDGLGVPTSVWPSKPQRASAPHREHWAGQAPGSLASAAGSAVLDGQRAVPPFAHQHFALRWRVVTALRLPLEKSIVVAHHPILAARPFALQPENAVPFRRPRGPEALAHRSAVLLPHQPQHFLPKLLVVSAIRCSPRAAVLQTRCPFLAIALPQPLRLPVTHAQELGRIHHPQLLALHPRQYPHPA